MEAQKRERRNNRENDNDTADSRPTSCLCNVCVVEYVDQHSAFIVWQRRGLTLHESTHNGFLQIMHPKTFHIKNPSDAKLASLSILRKWPVSMATIVKNRKIQKVQYLSTYSSYFYNIIFWTYVLEEHRSNGVMTSMFQGQLIAKIKIQRKINSFTLNVI